MAAAITSDKSYIVTDDVFAAEFNSTAFKVNHRLAGNPLFEWPRLRKLAAFLIENHGKTSVTCLTGSKGATAAWEDLDEAMDRLDECFEKIEEHQAAWILLKNISKEPEYAEVMNSIIGQVGGAIDDRGGPLTWPEPYLFLSSPGFVTPYHIDHEAGLLLQIAGTKDFMVFDGRDRSVLPETQVEEFYMGNMSAARMLDESKDKARKFPMQPGMGVCFPSLAPHWAQTGDSFSVTLSIGFGQRQKDLLANVYQANYYLRKLGLKPSPPGNSRVTDAIKRAPLALLASRNPQSMGESLRSGVYRLSRMLSGFRRPRSTISP